MLRLASRGFGNRQIAFTPCRFAVHALSLRPLPCFRKSSALSRVMVATARIVRSYRRRRSGAFRRPRRRRERLASPRARSLPPLHDSIAHYQRTMGTPARGDARPPGWSDRRMVGNLLTFLSPIRLAIRRPGCAGLHPVSPDASRCFVVQLSKIESPKGWGGPPTRFP